MSRETGQVIAPAPLTKGDQKALQQEEKAYQKEERNLRKEADKIEKAIIKDEERIEKIEEQIHKSEVAGKANNVAKQETKLGEAERALERDIHKQEAVELKINQLMDPNISHPVATALGAHAGLLNHANTGPVGHTVFTDPVAPGVHQHTVVAPAQGTSTAYQVHNENLLPNTVSK
eukprot:TRINITY_DN2124_c0_g2_i1.p1 TRINITY_DN2124_c0_g2~~TRINITY_DN2124_c0_g2_i1.p1  ORF type:complete len:176 (-),score=60.69 TRINITY_DN2124_c0_g2_i1:71-598(-)